MKWNKEVNKVIMECFYRSKPFDETGKPIRGYRHRMFNEWRNRGMFESTEQRVSDQARAIRKNGWLSELELEMIRRGINEESLDDVNITDKINAEGTPNNNIVTEIQEQEVDMNEINTVEVVEGVGDMSQEQERIVEELRKILID